MPITFLSDFGTADAYVGEVKGVLASGAPGVPIIDISHAVPPGNVRTAGYILGRTWSRFPPGTVHLIVVDPGVGTDRGALACAAGGHFFVAPDNGVLTPVLGRDDARLVRLEPGPDASPTFHGRDLFGPAAARLALAGRLDAVGTPFIGQPVLLTATEPVYQGKSVIGEVIHVDRFGNIITNLTAEHVPSYAVLEVEDTVIGPLRQTFGDVPAGELLAYLGSGGTVEIAVRDGSASRRLGLGLGGQVRARLG